MSVLAFLLAIVFGWVAGRVLPVSLQVQQDWIQKGVFPDGSLVYTKGQTTDSRTNDPWGNPYRLVYRGSATWRIYSCGPDGRDELGSGDDIPMGRGVGWSLAVMAIYGDAMLGMLGLAFAWLAAGTRVLWLPRSRNPRVENARAIGLLTVPAFVSWLAARAFGMELIALLPQRFVLPGDMVLWGTIGAVLVVAFFVVKGWRRANLKLAQA
ncbi:MAG: type II secretion system protein GspG [Planctomycetes bacterium]|nr:type II secretion system protein GspG [Planctomycetota bacterium]